MNCIHDDNANDDADCENGISVNMIMIDEIVFFLRKDN